MSKWLVAYRKVGAMGRAIVQGSAFEMHCMRDAEARSGGEGVVVVEWLIDEVEFDSA